MNLFNVFITRQPRNWNYNTGPEGIEGWKEHLHLEGARPQCKIPRHQSSLR